MVESKLAHNLGTESFGLWNTPENMGLLVFWYFLDFWLSHILWVILEYKEKKLVNEYIWYYRYYKNQKMYCFVLQELIDRERWFFFCLLYFAFRISFRLLVGN